MKTSSVNSDRIAGVRFPSAQLAVELMDGRIISAPLSWFPRLEHASPERRAKWELSAAGHGIHWPEIDEDLSVEGLLRGQKAPGGH